MTLLLHKNSCDICYIIQRQKYNRFSFNLAIVTFCIENSFSEHQYFLLDIPLLHHLTINKFFLQDISLERQNFIYDSQCQKSLNSFMTSVLDTSFNFQIPVFLNRIFHGNESWKILDSIRQKFCSNFMMFKFKSSVYPKRHIVYDAQCRKVKEFSNVFK